MNFHTISLQPETLNHELHVTIREKDLGIFSCTTILSYEGKCFGLRESWALYRITSISSSYPSCPKGKTQNAHKGKSSAGVYRPFNFCQVPDSLIR